MNNIRNYSIYDSTIDDIKELNNSDLLDHPNQYFEKKCFQRKNSLQQGYFYNSYQEYLNNKHSANCQLYKSSSYNQNFSNLWQKEYEQINQFELDSKQQKWRQNFDKNRKIADKIGNYIVELNQIEDESKNFNLKKIICKPKKELKKEIFQIGLDIDLIEKKKEQKPENPIYKPTLDIDFDQDQIVPKMPVKSENLEDYQFLHGSMNNSSKPQPNLTNINPRITEVSLSFKNFNAVKMQYDFYQDQLSKFGKYV